MSYLHQIPFVRVILPFIGGILTAIFTRFSFSFSSIYILPFALLLLLLTLFSKQLSSFKKRWIFGLFLSIFLFISGYNLCILHHYKQSILVTENVPASNKLFIATIIEPTVEKEKSVKAVLLIEKHKDSVWHNNSGKVMAYLEKDSNSIALNYGDKLIIHGKISEINPPQNPHEFNYKQHLINKGIHHSIFIRNIHWKKSNSETKENIQKTAYKIRRNLLKIYEDQNISGQEFAVASALIFGIRDYLDKDLMRKYSGAGAMHILCVSGLHVGVIFLILNTLLQFMDKKKATKILKAITIIALTWLYALITGLSPSVMRASTMFSFIALGTIFNRKANIYNSITASAFLLLLINPMMIKEIGFQLSYLAVLGIVSIQSALYNLWLPKNIIIDKTWAIITVSIAAQISTFPLSLFYFNQFPNFFIITNILVIPLSGLLIYSGILVFITSPLPIISSLITKLFIILIKTMNYSVSFIESLPFSISENIVISSFDTVFLYIIIILFSIFLAKKRKIYLFVTLVCVTLLCSSFSLRMIKQMDNKMFIVYNIKNHQAYDFINKNSNILLSDSLLIYANKIDYHIAPNWKNNAVHNNQFILINDNIEKHDNTNSPLIKRNNIIQFDRLRIAIAKKEPTPTISGNKLDIDFLIFTKNSNYYLEKHIKIYSIKKIIIDSSVPHKNRQQIVNKCVKNNIPYHSVSESGAFIFDID